MIQNILGAELKAILFDCGNVAAGASNPIRERRERELYSVGQVTG
jgi:hypothetical protein